MKKDNMRARRVWPWKALIGGVCVASALVIAFGMRGIDNPGGWPEWLFFPGIGLLALAAALLRAEWKAGQL